MAGYIYPAARTVSNYPGLANNNFYPTRRNGPVLGIGVHVTAGLQDLDGVNDHSAENTNRWGATTNTKASWAVCVDSDSIAPFLPETCTAWHIAGYNSRTFGIEISNKDARWDNKPSAWVTATLRNAARAAAPVVLKHGIPIRRATKTDVDAALTSGKPFGFVAHADLNPGTRTDPGKTFPWTRFLQMVREEIAAITNPKPTPAPTPTPSEEDELMALQIKHPTLKGVTWDAGDALWSMWTYAFNAAVDAKKSLAIQTAQAQKGAPLTVAETEQAVRNVLAEVEQEAGA